MRALIIALSAIALAGCFNQGVNEAIANQQHAQLYEAVQEVVCASSQDERALALGSLAEAMGNATLLQEDGRIHEDTVVGMAEDVSCE